MAFQFPPKCHLREVNALKKVSMVGRVKFGSILVEKFVGLLDLTLTQLTTSCCFGHYL